MNCAQARSLFDAKLDGDRPRGLAGHLGTCRACAAELRRLRRAMATLRASSLVPPVPGARERLLREIGDAPAAEIFDLETLADFLRIPPRELEPFLDEIPAFEIAGRLRFRRSSVERWIEERERAYAQGRRTMRLRLEAV